MVSPLSGGSLDVANFVNSSGAQTTQQINDFIANPGDTQAPEEGGGGGLISSLTSGIPLVGGLTDGIHKVVSSIPIVGGLLGGIF